MVAREQSAIVKEDVEGPDKDVGDAPFRADDSAPEGVSRVALLTPYSGGNLGDAAIQDAIIANLRIRLSDVQFSGICLNPGNFLQRHGTDAFPLCAINRPFYEMTHGDKTEQSGGTERDRYLAWLKAGLKRVPGLSRCLKAMRGLGNELRHCVAGYRFLRRHDLLIVSGGGQLDEEWGGAWGHPFTLFKWAILARIAQIPYAIVSVGACKVASPTSRFFLSAALRTARYRSYRDKTSKSIAASMVPQAEQDAVVPDAAFGFPPSELPSPAGVRTIAQGRTVVAISPICYARPESWPNPHRDVYERYLQKMAQVVAKLLEQDFFLLMVWSSVEDQKRAIPELLDRLDSESKKKLAGQAYIPEIATWRDLLAVLEDVDFVITSRLHGAILSFISQKPTIAISFDPKVDWVMEDLVQTGYLLHIRDFSANDVMEALTRIAAHKASVVVQIGSYLDHSLSISASQYDSLADLAAPSYRRNRKKEGPQRIASR